MQVGKPFQKRLTSVVIKGGAQHGDMEWDWLSPVKVIVPTAKEVEKFGKALKRKAKAK